jgi:hypothetical protein
VKILINRKPLRDRAWGGGNLFVTALCDTMSSNGHQVVYEFSEDIDVIFMQDPRYSDLNISINEIISYKHFKKDTKVIHRVNECDARKNTTGVDNLLRDCSGHTDHTVFVSEWMKNYHLKKGWKSDSSSVIYNGVNLDHFSKREKIQNGKINIVAHHWSNNRLKGFDIYEKIDKFVSDNDDFTFTYIGRHSEQFSNTRVIDPIYGKELGKELSKYDVYISGSMYDPGPNHILESLACRIPTYVISKGGGAVEFAGKSHAYDTFEDLVSILQSKEYKPNDYIPNTWEHCISEYMNVIDSMEK